MFVAAVKRFGGWRRLASVGAAVATAGGTVSCVPLPEWAAQPPPAGKATSTVAKYEESPEWVRADIALTPDSGEGHAIFHTLGARTNAVPMYRIYAKRDGSAAAAIATVAAGCDGHKGIVHGGVTALLFDNTLGWTNAFAVLADSGTLAAVLGGMQSSMAGAEKGGSPARFGFTANLLVNYRSPFMQGSTVELTCKVDRIEGRKRYLVGEMRNVETGQLIADCTSLFVIPRAAVGG